MLLAAGARQEFIRRLGEACAQLTPVPVSAALFGSVARNESRPDSDIDLLLVVEDDVMADLDGWTDQLYDLTGTVVRRRTAQQVLRPRRSDGTHRTHRWLH